MNKCWKRVVVPHFSTHVGTLYYGVAGRCSICSKHVPIISSRSFAFLLFKCSLCGLGLTVRRDNLSCHRRLYCVGFPLKTAPPPSADTTSSSMATESVVGSLTEGTDVFQVAVSADPCFSSSLQNNHTSTRSFRSADAYRGIESH